MLVRRAGSLSLPAVCAFALFACAPPPARSPLRERLAETDQPGVEAATRTCLDRGGWKVDPISDLIAGADVVTAARKTEQTQVFIQARDVVPRITGGPDDGDPFWPCLASEIEAAKSAPKPAE